MPRVPKYALHAGLWLLAGYVLANRIAQVPVVNKLPQV